PSFHMRRMERCVRSDVSVYFRIGLPGETNDHFVEFTKELALNCIQEFDLCEAGGLRPLAGAGRKRRVDHRQVRAAGGVEEIQVVPLGNGSEHPGPTDPGELTIEVRHRLVERFFAAKSSAFAVWALGDEVEHEVAIFEMGFRAKTWVCRVFNKKSVWRRPDPDSVPNRKLRELSGVFE